MVGAVVALFVIPDVSRKLEDDDRDWKEYLAKNGWEASWGDEVTQDPSGVILSQRGS